MKIYPKLFQELEKENFPNDEFLLQKVEELNTKLIKQYKDKRYQQKQTWIAKNRDDNNSWHRQNYAENLEYRRIKQRENYEKRKNKKK